MQQDHKNKMTLKMSLGTRRLLEPLLSTSVAAVGMARD